MKEKWVKIKTDKEYRARFILSFIIVIIIMATTLPIILASSMSYYRGDDFAEIGVTVSAEKRSIVALFADSLRLSKELFLNWNGTYFSKFIESFFSPLNGYGLAQLRAVMIANSLLFVIGICVFAFGICKQEIKSLQCKLLLVMSCFLGVLGFEAWYQIFYWYTGAAYYTLPLSLLLFAIALITLSNKKICYFLAGILLFCASGGSLAIAGTGCYWMLMIGISRLYKKRLCKGDISIFIVAFTGALMNALAPGNYMRQSVIDDSGLHLFRAVIYSFSEVVATAEWLFLETWFIVIVMVALGVGIYVGKRSVVDKTYSWLLIAVNAVTPIVTYYPVCLGYSSGGGPNRCRFILAFSFVVSVLIISVLAGKLIADYIHASHVREVAMVIILLMIIMPIKREGWKLSAMIPYRTMMELTEGNIQSYYRDANRIYDAISDDKNEDVFIYELPQDIDLFLPMNLTQNPNYLINSECAQYYEKNSVQYVEQPVYVAGDTYIRIAPSYFEQDLSYVSIFNNRDSSGVETIQKLQPFEKNLVLQVPEGETGTVVVYVFADPKGKTVIEQREFSY